MGNDHTEKSAHEARCNGIARSVRSMSRAAVQLVDLAVELIQAEEVDHGPLDLAALAQRNPHGRVWTLVELVERAVERDRERCALRAAAGEELGVAVRPPGAWGLAIADGLRMAPPEVPVHRSVYESGKGWRFYDADGCEIKPPERPRIVDADRLNAAGR